MPALDVVLIGAVEDCLAVGGEADLLDLEGSGRERDGCPAGRRNRIEVRPAVLLPGKDDAIAVGPEELIRRDDLAERAAATRVRAKGGARPSARDLRHADRPGRRLAMGPQDL